MIVAYNALSVRPGVSDGGATFTVNVLTHLPAALPGARIVVLARHGETRLDAPGLEVWPLRVPAGAAGRIAIEIALLPRELRRLRPTVFVSPNESLPLAVPSALVVVAQNLAYHDGGGEEFRGGTPLERAATALQAAYYRSQMRRTYRRADAVVAVSKETLRVLAERAGLPREKTFVVHEGSDSVLLPDPPAGITRERDRLLAVSALAPYKNLPRLVEAVALLRAGGRAIELEVVGADWRGYRASLERRIAAAGLTDAVRLAGGVPPARLAELYASCGAFIHLSSCESFGLPLLEAMRFGAPVVAADRSALPEVAGGAAVLVDPDRPAEVAAALAAVLDDPAGRDELARLGRERAAELTWHRTAAGIAAAVRAAAARRERASGGGRSSTLTPP